MTWPLPDDDLDRRNTELIPFSEWALSLSPALLANLLRDALWKGQIQQTELYRWFLLKNYKDTDHPARSKPKKNRRFL